jgi:L-ribulose-5-phosphate 4-epimerase
MLDTLRQQVLEANLSLRAYGLVTLTWGNVSGIDRERGLVVIKPSGVPYEAMTADDMVVVGLGGDQVEGSGRPSTDTPTHLELYRTLDAIGAVAHSHSTWATAWAQAEREIPILGTTHADLCPGPIPLTRPLTDEEVAEDYEASTGRVLVEAVGDRDSEEVPCVLVRGHGPFCWAGDPAAAVETSVTLEEVARLALLTSILDPAVAPLADAIRDRHFSRKHGPQAYYGQQT